MTESMSAKMSFNLRVVLLVSALVPASATAVEFEKIIDTSETVPCAAVSFPLFTNFAQTSLQDGKIVFHGNWGPVNAFEGLFKTTAAGGTELVITTHSSCSDFFPSNIGLFSFDGDNVAFDAFIGGQPGTNLVRQVGTDFEILLNGADTMPGYSNNFGSFGHISMRNGDLLWFSQSSFSSGEKGVYAYTGVTLDAVALPGDPVPAGSGVVGTLALITSTVKDDVGVAFQSGISGDAEGIFLDSGQGFITVVDSATTRPGGSELLSSLSSQIAMQGGDIAFIGRFSDPQFNHVDGVYSTRGGLHTVADTTMAVPGGQGNFDSFPYNPIFEGGLSIGHGITVFVGREVVNFQNIDSIFAEYQGTVRKVIGANDILDGDTVTQLRFTRESFDGNSLAFNAQLDPYRQGVFLARNVGSLVRARPDTDMDGDGRSDVMFRNLVTGANRLYLMQGLSIGQNLAMPAVSADWEVVGQGDYDGDFQRDVLLRHASGAYWIYFMEGNVLRSSQFVTRISNVDWKVVGNGDYNGDGMSDILWYNQASGTVWLYAMDGNRIVMNAGIGRVPDTNWQIVGSGDYDGDGKSDVLWHNSATGGTHIYLMNGAVIKASNGVSVASPDYRVVGNGDYDGDGKSDILWRNTVSGTNWLYLMNGTSIATSASISVMPDTNWKIVGDGDYNGDGKADVLWRNVNTGTNWMYLMDGLAITASAQVSVVTDQNWQVVNTN